MESLRNDLWKEKLKILTDRLGSGFIFGLVGSRGCGKTQMAVQLVKTQIENPNSARFCTALEFFVDVKTGFVPHEPGDRADQGERQALNYYMGHALLVIDEVQERGATPWEDRLLTYLINKRYEQKKDTLLISNEKPEEFVKSIGSSVASRICETGGIIHCDWESFRK